MGVPVIEVGDVLVGTLVGTKLTTFMGGWVDEGVMVLLSTLEGSSFFAPNKLLQNPFLSSLIFPRSELPLMGPPSRQELT